MKGHVYSALWNFFILGFTLIGLELSCMLEDARNKGEMT